MAIVLHTPKNPSKTPTFEGLFSPELQMNPLFYRSALISSSLSRRALSALLSPGRQHLRFCTASSQHDHFSSDSEDNLDLGSALHSPANPSWFDGLDLSGTECAVSGNWDDKKTCGKRREEETEIAKLFISPEIVSRLAQRGITKLFPIQRAVLDPAMRGRDMICRAITGTGKTLAYGIPIMDKIIRFKATPQAKRRRGRHPLALVMTPTRELAQQVEKEFRESSSLKSTSVYGGEPLARQLNELNYGIDVLVGTPGRINELLNRNILNVSQVQFLVLDESDEILSVSFAEIVEKILVKLPRRRQSVMFSSTMPSWMTEFQDIYLNDPLIIDLVSLQVGKQKLPEGISLYSIASDDYQKPSIIAPLISEHAKGGKCIVFTQAKSEVDWLSDFIGRNFKCEPIYADMHQNRREKTLSGFCDGSFNVLVATDVAARGLDIPDVDLVIHYEVPAISEPFLHRSGRTGRAGKKGKVILIYKEEQIEDVRKIEQDLGCKFAELPRMTVADEGQLVLTDIGGRRFDPIRRYQLGSSDIGHPVGHSLPRTYGSRISGSRSDQFGGISYYKFRRSQLDELGSGHSIVPTNLGSKLSVAFGAPGFGRSDAGGVSRSRLGECVNSLFRQSDSIKTQGTVDSGRSSGSGLSFGVRCDSSSECSDGGSGPEHGPLSGSHNLVSDCSDGGSGPECSGNFGEPHVRIAGVFQRSTSSYSSGFVDSGSSFGTFCHETGGKDVDPGPGGFSESGTKQCTGCDDSGSGHGSGFDISISSNSDCSSNSSSGFGSFGNTIVTTTFGGLNDSTNE